MNTTGRYILVLCLGLFMGIGITMERTVLAEKTDMQPLPLDTLRIFTEVFGKVKSDYVESVEDKKLLEDAIHGMLAGLDPHSSYLSPESFKEMRIGTEGKFGGLGIEVTMENGFVKVVAPIDDTPAETTRIPQPMPISQGESPPLRTCNVFLPAEKASVYNLPVFTLQNVSGNFLKALNIRPALQVLNILLLNMMRVTTKSVLPCARSILSLEPPALGMSAQGTSLLSTHSPPTHT